MPANTGVLSPRVEVGHMQVPGPFEYERATSVDHAIGLLDRLGDGAMLVAGGHSLLPMMKLRIANPEYLVDINDLIARTWLHRRRSDGRAYRCDDASPRSTGVGRAGGGVPHLPRRRTGHRRSRRAQPRHCRGIAVSGRPRRGSHDRVHGAERSMSGPRPVRGARNPHRRFPDRAVRDFAGAQRDAHRDTGSVAAPTAPAHTPRWNGGSATGR